MGNWGTNRDPEWRSTREAFPTDEFGDLEEILVGAFPHVFVLGSAYSPLALDDSEGTDKTQRTKMKGLYKQLFRHLLLQYTTAAATNREPLFIC
jgi:hypothetical protein